MIAKFEGLIEPRRCVDMKGIVPAEVDPNRFTTFEKQAPGFYDLFKCTSLSDLTAHVKPTCVIS